MRPGAGFIFVEMHLLFLYKLKGFKNILIAKIFIYIFELFYLQHIHRLFFFNYAEL